MVAEEEEKRRILLYLFNHSGENATVLMIAKHLDMSTKVVSDRLTTMKEDGLVGLARDDPCEVWGATRRGMCCDLVLRRKPRNETARQI